ncbi:MAG: hypothetical protein M0T79_12480 [Actinomycetota bacterium]|jgi:hypothetical protein|nr:hypothetical protein [Actinomycetota bacterium]
MGEIPLDARRIVDELRSSRREVGTVAPKVWAPSESFDSTIAQLNRVPVHLNDHLGWMHQNWDLRALLAPPPAKGAKGIARRLAHRAVMAVLGPYFDRLQDYLGVNVRALDAVAKRTDEESVAQLRLMGAVRADLIDFAHHVDERVND